MFRYYQLAEDQPWSLVEDTESAIRAVMQRGAKRLTILSVSDPVTDSADRSKLLYKGPFYADIDHADLSVSILSAKELVSRLISYGVAEENMEIYCSGSKGFHILVHPKCFYDGRALKNLPKIYAQVATDLYVPGMDFSPYAGERGNVFRVPNVQRPDGKYKVRITNSELESMTVAEYATLTSGPRNIYFLPMSAPNVSVSSLLEMFQSAKKRIVDIESANNTLPVESAELARFKTDPPGCIRELTQGHSKGQVTFNRVAFQLAIYLLRSGTDKAEMASIINLASKNLQSTTYSTERDRSRHIYALLSYLSHRPDKKFSCAGMRSVVSSSPCSSCPIQGVSMALDSGFFIVARDDGYYDTAGKENIRLTSFTLTPIRAVHVIDKVTEEKRREHIVCTVEVAGETVGTVAIDEDAWGSRSKFIACFTGIGNLTVTATDVGVQRLKHHILTGLDELDTQELVSTVGVQRDIIFNYPRYTWVELGFSVNKMGVTGTHLYNGPNDTYIKEALPQFLNIKLPDQVNYDYVAALRAFWGVNESRVTSVIFGWIFACFLKAHIHGIRGEFPLLNLWGGRGSGKTPTASWAAHFHGCQYSKYPAPQLSAGTLFPVIDAISSTTTVPRILDEVNEHGVGRNYHQILEMLKGCYNGAPTRRGGLTSGKEKHASGIGVVSRSLFATAPVLYISEHSPDLPALLDRSVRIQLHERSLRPRNQQANIVRASLQRYMEIGKAALILSLKTTDDWVTNRIDAWVDTLPDRFTERQRYGRAVVGVGLDFSRRVFNSLKIPVEDDINSLEADFRSACVAEATSRDDYTNVTEMSRALLLLGEAATLKRHGSSVDIPDKTYKKDGEILIIDVVHAFAAINNYSLRNGRVVRIHQISDFKALILAEQYYLGFTLPGEHLVSSRPSVKLSMTMMRENGIDTTMF